MNSVGDGQSDPLVIGNIAEPPFVRLSEPLVPFAKRADRFDVLTARCRQSGSVGILTDLIDP